MALSDTINEDIKGVCSLQDIRAVKTVCILAYYSMKLSHTNTNFFYWKEQRKTSQFQADLIELKSKLQQNST